MVKEREVYFNGKFRRWDEANVHVMSHSFGRGSAIFEVVGFHDTPEGPAVFRLDEYLSRFWKSASLLEMEPPLTQVALQEAILTLVKRSGLKSGFFKLYGFYPEISYRILPPQRKFQIAVCPYTAEDALGQPQPPESAPRGVTAFVSRWRRLDPRTVPIEAKVAANYVNGMVARMEAREKGLDYAILLDVQGFIAEGGTESLFLVRDGRLLTSALGTVLQSITRKTLLEVAETMGIETSTGLLNPEELDRADEIFFSGTSAKLLPVRQVGERILNEVPGPLTRRLAERMEAITSGRDEQFRHWLFPA